MVGRQLGIIRRYGIHPLVYYQQCDSMESTIANRPPAPVIPAQAGIQKRRRNTGFPPARE
jgi:hypothetical protein